MLSTESFIAIYSRRYKIALIVIAVAITSFFAILNEQQVKQKDSAKIINVAGQQRMLYQRIELLLYLIQHSDHAEFDTLNKLKKAANTLLSNQAFLESKLNTTNTEFSRRLTQLFYHQEKLVDQIHTYANLALRVAQEDKNITNSSLKPFQNNHLLNDLNITVSLFEQSAIAQQDALQKINFALWALSLFIILFLIIAIFHPMQRWLSSTYQKLLLERNRVKDFQFAINKHSVVMRVDINANLLFYNKKFTSQYGYDQQELIGKTIKTLRSGIHSDTFYETVHNALMQRKTWYGEICTRAKNGNLYWFNTTIVPLRYVEGQTESSIIIQNDITERKRTVEALTKIQTITSNDQIKLDDKIQQLLILGRDIFNLSFAVISHIEPKQDIYQIRYVSAPNNEIIVGTQYSLKNTYCAFTLKANRAVAYHHVTNSEIAHQACYQDFTLESYIGCPLFVAGQCVGTLNFSCTQPNPQAFTESDLEIIQLLSHRIGHELMRAEQESKLLSQQKLMTQMSQQAKVGAWEFDLMSNRIYWSEMTKTIHGVDSHYEPQLDTAIRFYKSGYSRDKIRELINQAIETGTHYQEELQLITAQGKEIWVEVRGQTEIEQTQCVRLFGSIQDITERIEAQNKLQLSNQRLAFVMASTGVGIWDWEIDTGKTIYNERWADIIGYKLSELEPTNTLTCVDLMHPEDFTRSEKALKAHWEQESDSYLCEIRMRHKAGHWVWILDTGKVVEWHQDGRPKRMIGTHLDISASKQAKQEIQDKNERMALAADSAGIGIWDYDLIDGTLTWDSWMFKLYGLQESEFSGAYHNWQDSIHPEDKERIDTLLQHVITHNEKFHTQFKIIQPDGQVRHIQASAFNKVNSEGHVTNMIGVKYDVTERVKYEEALYHAKIAAETAVIAKNEFLASMSHEIRTPMNGVIGMLDLLKAEQLSKEQQHKVIIAQNSANSLLILINDILDFSKIDADKLELEHIEFDLTTMLGELCESFAMACEAKGLELILDSTDLPRDYIISDPSRIRQILTNLIGNAIKFTHHGEILVSAHLKVEDDNQSELTLKVKDTGIGIPDEKKTMIFDAFIQADSSTTRHYGGTGLGLAIVKKLCNKMDGAINVISQEGHGSEFICTLKVIKSNTDLLPIFDMPQLHMLIVDDNQTTRTIIEKQVRQWNIQVASCANEKDAELAFEKQINSHNAPFDIALIDMNIPGIGGTELAKRIQDTFACSDTTFILMTSMQTRGDAAFFAKLGFSGYFPKPATVSDLKNILVTSTKQSCKLNKAQTLDNTLNNNVSKSSKINETAELSGLQILLVEDNPVNQLVATGMLKALMLNCDTANNGLEALSKINDRPTPYDVILMDIQMPEMDGFQTTRKIREGYAGALHSNTTIIAMTANAMKGDKDKCLDAGMNEYLAKPINLEALKSTLMTCKK